MTTLVYPRDASFWPRSKAGGKTPKYHLEALDRAGEARCSRRIMLDTDAVRRLDQVPPLVRCGRCFPEPHDSGSERG